MQFWNQCDNQIFLRFYDTFVINHNNKRKTIFFLLFLTQGKVKFLRIVLWITVALLLWQWILFENIVDSFKAFSCLRNLTPLLNWCFYVCFFLICGCGWGDDWLGIKQNGYQASSSFIIYYNIIYSIVLFCLPIFLIFLFFVSSVFIWPIYVFVKAIFYDIL